MSKKKSNCLVVEIKPLNFEILKTGDIINSQVRCEYLLRCTTKCSLRAQYNIRCLLGEMCSIANDKLTVDENLGDMSI